MRPVDRNNARPVATSPLRTPLPKTPREAESDARRLDVWSPLADEFHNLRSRYVTLFTAQQVPSSLDRTFDHNLRRHSSPKLADTARPIGYGYVHDKTLRR